MKTGDLFSGQTSKKPVFARFFGVPFVDSFLSSRFGVPIFYIKVRVLLKYFQHSLETRINTEFAVKVRVI